MVILAVASFYLFLDEPSAAIQEAVRQLRDIGLAGTLINRHFCKDEF